ncbi:hypothetical protein GCM10023115_01670 [Pontixanthobacter gangjinensis]|uniref:Uncharacterized protein n=1 Tax=Pontixanthobacter gangjinensis TaxID=1028742 RepID=A0A6I4SKV6_9SPHN|nr:hypothetical protein [Pontixanthobacter gangjinensis]MXO55422.1 hypothetical protein [Pontixanthobacter gangjinensis]
MTNLFQNSLAAFAALLIASATMMPVVTVPPAQASEAQVSGAQVSEIVTLSVAA